MNNETRATILVVDDVPDNIMLLDEVLNGTYNISAATSGERALKLIQSPTPPDLVLLDVMMPGLDGFEVCRRIKADDRTAFIPVVMVTTLSGQTDRIEALQAGADDFLSKPIDPTEVHARVRSLLRMKRLHDQLQRSYVDLQKLEEMRENLTHMIIHDLRTPLTAIMGALSLLFDYAGVEGNAGAEEMHEMATQNSDKLLRMINDLLDITKMESGELQLELQPLNLGSLITEVESTLRPVAQIERITLSSQCEPDLNAGLADKEIMTRVLVNLVANALKFTPVGGSVTISGEGVSDNLVTLRVIDNGPGIPPGYEEKIFEKFGQVSSGERKKLSTGLGLTFCKMAVEAHGGSIRAGETPGGGSTFTVEWPVAGARKQLPDV